MEEQKKNVEFYPDYDDELYEDDQGIVHLEPPENPKGTQESRNPVVDPVVEQDLQESAIEKVKPKRKQSKKQLEAFEKARQKRKENIAQRKAEKAQPKPPPTPKPEVPDSRVPKPKLKQRKQRIVYQDKSKLRGGRSGGGEAAI